MATLLDIVSLLVWWLIVMYLYIIGYMYILINLETITLCPAHNDFEFG